MASKIAKCNNCNIVICEVLAFVQNKMDVMDEESLVKLCVSAFSVEDIDVAKTLLFASITTKKRNISRRKDGKSQRDLYDVISVLKVTDPDEVPIFCCKRTPKTSSYHVWSFRSYKGFKRPVVDAERNSVIEGIVCNYLPIWRVQKRTSTEQNCGAYINEPVIDISVIT